MATVMNKGTFSKAVYPKPFTSWIGLGYQMAPDVVGRIFDVKSSDQSVEEITILTGMGVMTLTPEGNPTPYDNMGQGLTKRVTHSDYRQAFSVTKNLIRDGKAFSVVQKGAAALGKSYRETRNRVAIAFLENIFNSGYTSADGAIIVSASHPTSIGNQSNILSTAGALSETSLEQLCLEMKDIKDDAGLRIVMAGKKLIVPPELEYDAYRILNSEKQVYTPDNTPNALKGLRKIPGGFDVIDYLTDTTAWYLTTDQTQDGLTFFDRQGLEIDNDTHFETDNFKTKSHARMSVVCGEWRCIMASEGTGG